MLGTRLLLTVVLDRAVGRFVDRFAPSPFVHE